MSTILCSLLYDKFLHLYREQLIVAFEAASMELRRGTLVLAVMLRLHEPHYGYSLRQALLKIGIRVEEGTLYPLLRRFEEKGLLSSEWSDHDGRSRRYYVLTAGGIELRDRLVSEWRVLGMALNRCITNQEMADGEQ